MVIGEEAIPLVDITPLTRRSTKLTKVQKNRDFITRSPLTFSNFPVLNGFSRQAEARVIYVRLCSHHAWARMSRARRSGLNSLLKSEILVWSYCRGLFPRGGAVIGSVVFLGGFGISMIRRVGGALRRGFGDGLLCLEWEGFIGKGMGRFVRATGQ